MKMDPQTIRDAAGLSRAELAQRMGLSDYRAVFRIEKERSDWLLSTIAAYVQAAGGHADLVVRINGQELPFNIA